RGLARDRSVGGTADLHQVVVGALLDEDTDLLDARKILHLCPRRECGLDRALRQRADRPALHIGFGDAGERTLGGKAIPEDRDRILALVDELLDEALPAHERPHRALDADLREQAGLQRTACRIAAVESLPHREIATSV